MAAFLVMFSVFIVLLILYMYKFSKRRPNNFPPGPPRLPIWGSYWFILKENYFFAHKSVEVLAKRYETDVLGLFLGSVPAIVTFNYDLCKEALAKEEFSGRNDTIITRSRSFGELLGLFFVDGPSWKEQRRFSLRHLRDYGFGRRFAPTEALLEKEMRDLIDMITSEPKPSNDDVLRKKGQMLAPDVFYAPVLNQILHMLVGRRFNDKELRELARASLRFLRSGDALGGALSITPWLRYISPDFFGYAPIIAENKLLKDFMQEHIVDHKISFSNDLHADFTDVYLSKLKRLGKTNESGSTFSDQQLLWVLLDYMFPAPLAIGHTLTYLFAYLLNYPETQVKMQEEIDRVVGSCRLPTLEDRKLMPYTEAVIRESLRKDPIIPLGVPRRCTQDTTFGGYSIPKDTVVLISLYSAHNDPKIWGDPEKFRPERFLNEEGNLLKKDYTMGFGAGKRLCVGETFARQSMFLMVASLLQNFTFKQVEKLPNPNDQVLGLLVSMDSFWIEAIGR